MVSITICYFCLFNPILLISCLMLYIQGIKPYLLFSIKSLFFLGFSPEIAILSVLHLAHCKHVYLYYSICIVYIQQFRLYVITILGLRQLWGYTPHSNRFTLFVFLLYSKIVLALSFQLQYTIWYRRYFNEILY